MKFGIFPVAALAVLSFVAVSIAAPGMLSEVNAALHPMVATHKYGLEDIASLQKCAAENDGSVYLMQLLGYLHYTVGNYGASQHFGNAALVLHDRLFPHAVVSFFQDNIVVRKEELLINLALSLFHLNNERAANELVEEAILIADNAYARRGSASPRSRVYRTLSADRGINYLAIQPVFALISDHAVLRSVPAAIPWVKEDDYEHGNPLAFAPSQKKMQDGAGQYAVGQQRFPPTIDLLPGRKT